ncbi:MAG: hypothetical protein J7M34_09835 [Anaerolineae bacterium]|nr:hypothetical protein [Anaerolineae bacterium]
MARIGEIVETNSLGFVAESFELHRPPALGSLVRVSVDDRSLYAVVSFGATTGIDPGRRAVRRSTEEVFDEAIYREHPQLERTLRTEFQAVLVGVREDDGPMRQVLPPQPPPLHYSVWECTADEVCAFTERLVYFRLLWHANGGLPADQLLAAHIRAIYAARGDDLGWLEGAAREVATLLRDDYDSLMSVLQGIEP